MLRFLIRRLLFGTLVLWLVSVSVFLLFFVAPHDPARLVAGRLASPETLALVRRRLGLDQPIFDQYRHFLGRLVHGDLGYSYYNSEPVRSLLFGRLPVTVSLALGAAALWLAIGIGVGVLSARRPGSAVDRAATVFVLTGLSTPTFLLGLLLLYVLFYRLHLAGFDFFPGGGYIPFTQDPAGWAQHLILPWLTVAIVSAATYTRLTRTSLLEVFSQDYIRTARAKGLSERRVVYRHGLRSGLTPVVTQLGIDVGALLGGAIVTENVFGLPGLGQLAVQSVTTQDLPVIIGIVLLAALFIILANIAVDALYAVLDPRVRLH
ncbi:MAG TPA: ABC transporter permease [Actinomycetes bacterium]|nr:ABC transporter permease [Actinomycetes bacterium]